MDTVAARKARIGSLKTQLDARLAEIAPPAARPLASAMHYALATPGKRLRPLLLLLTAAQLGSPVGAALDAACALEMVHAASLVLDDLPCMDDAASRRGEPSTHVRFGEDVAILAGVALLNLAYGLLARAGDLDASTRLEMVGVLSGAVGMDGLVAGQELDLHAPAASLASLREAHHQKTGVLFLAAVRMGGLVGGASAPEARALERFATEFGLAFQARDDVSDAQEAEPDAGLPRSTLISLLGRDGALREAEGRMTTARLALADGGVRLEPLCAYVDLLLGERGRMAEAAS